MAPSDMIVLAQVGCGTQAQRQVNTGHRGQAGSPVRRRRRSEQGQPELRRLGATWGNRDTDSPLPRRADLGRGRHGHPRRPGRRPADHGDVLQEAESSRRGIRVLRGLPGDAREGDRHPGHREHHAGPSARRHQHLGAAERQGRDRAQAGRQRAVRAPPHAAGRPRELGASRICWPTATRRTGTRSRRGSRPASSATCARCTTGRTARSGRRDGRSTTSPGRRCRPASTGRCGRGPSRIGPYHPSYTHAVYRGLVRLRRRLPRRHGLLQPVAAVPHPEPRRPRVRRGQAQQRRVREREATSATAGVVSLVGFPKASTVRWRHPATASRPSVDTFWYDGGMKPQTPEELYDDDEDLADRGHAAHRRQGQDPVRLQGATSRVSSRRAASARSRDPSPRRTSTRRRPKTNG